jgi:hypothetical protein
MSARSFKIHPMIDAAERQKEERKCKYLSARRLADIQTRLERT